MLQETEAISSSDKFSDCAPLIALRTVSRFYDDGAIAALTDVELEIQAGDCVAIVGASSLAHPHHAKMTNKLKRRSERHMTFFETHPMPYRCSNSVVAPKSNGGEARLYLMNFRRPPVTY